jgi:phosphoribosyl-ATP pyrophosphohydrolase
MLSKSTDEINAKVPEDSPEVVYDAEKDECQNP